MRTLFYVVVLALPATAFAGKYPYIVGGGVTPDWDATVALVWGKEAGCTGTLVAPHLVMTAAHCLEQGDPDVVVFGHQVAAGRAVAVRETRIHPRYDFFDEEVAADIGVIELVEDVLDVDPAALDASPASGHVGGELVYVGYGDTEGTGGEGWRKAATGELVAVQGDVLVVEPSDGSACWGDSGGPLYRQRDDGSAVVTGVVSFGYTDDCLDLGGNTRVDWYAEWVLHGVDRGEPERDDAGDLALVDGYDDDTGVWDGGERPGGCSVVGGAGTGAAIVPLGLLLALLRRKSR